jgi:protein-L-isoaspartate(D-aspartate) O-methyltransferase
VTRTGPKEFKTVALWETVAPRLQGFPEPERFQF